MSLKQEQRKPMLKGDRQRRIHWPCIPAYGQ
jgi:hypothetical protein